MIHLKKKKKKKKKQSRLYIHTPPTPTNTTQPPTYQVERLGQKWKQLQAELGRSADACRDKYRELSAALQQTQGANLAPLQLPSIGQVGGWDGIMGLVCGGNVCGDLGWD